MRQIRLTIPIVALAFLLFGTFSLGNSDDSKNDASLADIIVTTSEKELLVFAVLKNSFNDEMLQGLHSGIPVRFSFYIELIQEEKNWPDKELTSMQFKHVLTYDTLKEMYRIELTEMKKNYLTFKSLTKAQKALNEINNLSVIKLDQLQPDRSYQLRLKAVLYKKSLPMKLHYIVPFISWWDIETDWHTIDFKY